MKCKYEAGEMTGLECPCDSCRKTRELVFGKELDGEIHVVGLERDKKSLAK